MNEELYAKLLAAAARVENEVARQRDFPSGASRLGKRMMEGTIHDKPIRRVHDPIEGVGERPRAKAQYIPRR